MELLCYEISTSNLFFANTLHLSLPIGGVVLCYQQIFHLNSCCNFRIEITKSGGCVA